MLGRLVIMKKCHVVCIFDVKNTSAIKIISPVKNHFVLLHFPPIHTTV